MTTAHDEYQRHIDDFDTYLREQPTASRDLVQSSIDFARRFYDPHAAPARFSTLVERLYPLAEEHSRAALEREMARVMAEPATAR